MHSPASGHLSHFPVFAIMRGAAINILLHVFWGTRASFSGGLSLGVGLPSHRVYTPGTLLALPSRFAEQLQQFTVPPARHYLI